MIKIKGWDKFQHFKDRRPPWIKLYRELLDDLDWHDLAGEDAKALVMLWLIASENDGSLPDVRKLAFRLRLTEDQTNQTLTRLSHWLDRDDIAMISDRYQDATPETETETETEKRTAGAVTSIYAFEAGVIRLRKNDFEKWEASFPDINLRAELLSLQQWAGKQENWFFAVQGALAKRNRDALKSKTAAAELQKSDGLTEFERNNIKHYGTKNRNLWGVT